ncbi:helix-turn-helix transcriptional regulator [Leisingera aquaemixtae]|uniref:Helix-turn-helix transcriptional regulator n=1 Tax=Leisingera aquaemixtae TaxID=1396826 RepID=A0ABY5WF17_9RHOB|nr:helix-turn-helix transcriptional regulator [Leisingera aquaemixtae]UWQ40065.1 helix-turn-helix transcriptional regulator [Leisingera aquaemixtae]
MTYFDFDIDEKDLASAKFIGETRRGLVKCLINARMKDPSISQSKIAEKIGMDKSSLSRILNGQGNVTLRTIAEVAWALNLEPEVHFCEHMQTKHSNTPRYTVCGAHKKKAESFDWDSKTKSAMAVKVKNSQHFLSLKNES